MAHDRSTPCGSLPQLHISVHLFYCEHHQAWSIHTHSYLESGPDILDVVPFTAVDLGPFDDSADALDRVADFVAQCQSREH